MNKEEAIQILADLIDNPFLHTWEKQNKALHMAIEALQFSKHFDLLKEYQSLQEVIRCKDCRYCTEYYDRDGYPYWICDEWDGGTDADGFCHYGERKKR